MSSDMVTSPIGYEMQGYKLRILLYKINMVIHVAICNRIMCVKVQYVIYGNEGCGRETHTARGAAECCMGLETTARVPVSHVLNDKTHIMCFIVTSKLQLATETVQAACSPTRL